MNSFQEWVHYLIWDWVNSARGLFCGRKNFGGGWVGVVKRNTTPWNDSGSHLLLWTSHDSSTISLYILYMFRVQVIPPTFMARKSFSKYDGNLVGFGCTFFFIYTSIHTNYHLKLIDRLEWWRKRSCRWITRRAVSIVWCQNQASTLCNVYTLKDFVSLPAPRFLAQNTDYRVQAKTINYGTYN